MPLSKAKQAEYQRERRARLKLGRTQPIVIPKQGILSNLRELMSTAGRGEPSSFEDGHLSPPPVYDPRIHKAGTTVMVKGVTMVVPELDADGQAVPE